MSTEPRHAQPPHDADRDPGQDAPQREITRTRLSGAWIAIGFFSLVLLFLLIFILQNGRSVDISYLGSHSRLPLGVALLLSAVCGVLLVVLAGTARILQLRAAARRHRRADAKAAKAEAKAAKAEAKAARAEAKAAPDVPPGTPD